MHAGEGLRQVAVALIGDDDTAAGLGNQEVGTGDADIGCEEALAQLRACLGEDVAAFGEDAIRRQVGVGFAEAFLPVFLV